MGYRAEIYKLVERDGAPYFLYNTDSTPQPEGGPSSWGATAFISAVDEGLAGINDIGVNYDEIYFAPKFPVTYYTELRYLTGYEVSGTLVDVRYILKEIGMRYDIYSPAKNTTAHIMLPHDRDCSKLSVNGVSHDFAVSTVGKTKYVDFSLPYVNKEKVSIEIIF